MNMTRGAVRVTRIAGIDIRLDWSLLVTAWLLLMNLRMGLLATRHPDWSPALSWGMAALGAVLFILSILAHELSHALVGRARGVPIAGITLFMFGGVAQMRREPTSPRAELLMTIVGPLTSLVIGLLSLVAAGLMTPSGAFDAGDPLAIFQGASPLVTILLWLGPLNIMLAVFNLLPGFPLDGGRILRAILWSATGDLKKATRWASGTGQAFGMLLVFAGVGMIFGLRVPFFGQGVFGGLWIAFIGWFLHSAARASYAQVVLRDLLTGVPVAKVMTTKEATIPAEATLSTLVDDYLMGTDQRAFPVVDGERLAGFVALEDVRRIPRERWPGLRVRDIMTKREELVVAAPDEDMSSAEDKLMSRNVQQLPVVDGERLLGVLRQRDVLRWLELQPTGAA